MSDQTDAEQLELDPSYELNRLATDLLEAGLSPGRCESCGHVFVEGVDEWCQDEDGVLLCMMFAEGGETTDCPKYHHQTPTRSNLTPTVQTKTAIFVDEEGKWVAGGWTGGTLGDFWTVADGLAAPRSAVTASTSEE